MKVCSKKTRKRLIHTTLSRFSVSLSALKAITAWCVVHAAANNRTTIPVRTVTDRC